MTTAPQLTTVEICREDLGFSAGHFTIFSATERENMHGHNYAIYAAITTSRNDEGLSFDYRYYKNILRQYCQQLNGTFLLPQYSKYLTLEESDDYVYAIFDEKKMPFLKKDVTILPITNTTIEELSAFFLKQFVQDRQTLATHNIRRVVIKVFSSPGQSGSATWEDTADWKTDYSG